jgi:hypothetical protein
MDPRRKEDKKGKERNATKAVHQSLHMDVDRPQSKK